MSRETSPHRPSGLSPEEYRSRRQDIEFNFNKSKQLICADITALRKAVELHTDAMRRINSAANSLKDLGVEYNSTYSSMGSMVDAAWTTHPMYDRLVAIVLHMAEQRYEIGRGLTEYDYYKCQIVEVKTRMARRRDEQLELRTEIESLTTGKATLIVDCICEAEAQSTVLEDDVLSLARKHQNLSSNTIANEIFEWFRMQQKLADNTQISVPAGILCSHGQEGPRRPSARALSTPQLPSWDLMPATPDPSSLMLSTKLQRISYRTAAITWRDSPEFLAVLNGEYSQMKINSFPEPPIGNLINHTCPEDPFWPFVNCCRCDVRELIFWQSDFPKCLPLLKRAFTPLRFAVECSKETRDDLARLARGIHTTLDSMTKEILDVEEQGITLLK